MLFSANNQPHGLTVIKIGPEAWSANRELSVVSLNHDAFLYGVDVVLNLPVGLDLMVLAGPWREEVLCARGLGGACRYGRQTVGILSEPLMSRADSISLRLVGDGEPGEVEVSVFIGPGPQNSPRTPIPTERSESVNRPNP